MSDKGADKGGAGAKRCVCGVGACAHESRARYAPRVRCPGRWVTALWLRRAHEGGHDKGKVTACACTPKHRDEEREERARAHASMLALVRTRLQHCRDCALSCRRAAGCAGGHAQKQKKQYIGGRGSGQVKVDKGKGFRTAAFDRLRQSSVRGVLISCDVRSEGLCVRESMMAVREHCSRRYPDLFKDDDAEDEKSDAAAVTNVEDAIAAEAAKEKASVQQGPFGMIETKTKGLLFIEFHNEKMNPVEICADCLKEVRDTGRTKTKYLVRMTPVLATCYAKYEEIKKAVQPILDKYLNASMEATTYCIVYKKRSNEDLDRLKLINELAEKVDKKHKVDLTMPKTAILIDIMTNVCCIGVCDDYFALRKYNVQVSRSAHPASPPFRSRAQVPQKSRW